MIKMGDAFKGFDVAFTGLRMFWQMLRWLVIFCLIFQIIAIVFIIYFGGKGLYGEVTPKDRCLASQYWSLKAGDAILGGLSRNAMFDYTCDGSAMAMHKQSFYNIYGEYVETRTKFFLDSLKWAFFRSLWIYALIPLLCVFFAWKHKKDSKDRRLRGATLVTGEELGKLIQKRAGNAPNFYISQNVSIPLEIITRHTLVLGKPGSGKTQLISRIIRQIMDRGFRAIIHDFKGDMISTFYDHRKHLIFNPLDKRHMGLKDREQDLIAELNGLKIGDLEQDFVQKHEGLSSVSDRTVLVSDIIKFDALLDEITEIIPHIINPKHKKIVDDIMQRTYPVCGWTIFNELQTIVDVEAFCGSLIPESASQDNFWPISCRQLLGATINFCIYHGKTTHADLWDMVNKSNEELLEMFKTTPGCEEGMKLLTEAKTANNILAVLSNYTKSFKFLLKTEGAFSIKNWVGANDHPKRVIFLSNTAMIQETMKPFLTMFVDFATKSLCSLTDDLRRRLHFVLDEFGQLGKIGSIIQLLTQSRSKGGATYLLIQDVSQITAIYGQEGCGSIVNSCGNLISFAVKDKEAEFVSKGFGSMEIKRTEENKSIGVSDMKDSLSISQQTVEKQIVLPSEIINLPTLNYYIHLTDYPVAKDKLDIISYPVVTVANVQRDDLYLKTKSGGEVAAPNGREIKAVVAAEAAENEMVDEIFGGGEGSDRGDDSGALGDVSEEHQEIRAATEGLEALKAETKQENDVDNDLGDFEDTGFEDNAGDSFKF